MFKENFDNTINQSTVEQAPDNFEKFSQSEEVAIEEALAKSENQVEASEIANVLKLLTKKSKELMAKDSLSAEQKSRFQQAV